MSEKTTLLPTAPQDNRFVGSGTAQHFAINPDYIGPTPWATRIVIAPGLEFVPTRKYRYGIHALLSALFILIAFVLVEVRECNFGIGIDLDLLQSLHICMLVLAFTLYLMSLFGIADFLFQFKLFFAVGLVIVYAMVGLMIWMVYEAAVNPCVKSFNGIPGDIIPAGGKNVFSRHDGIGIAVLLFDIVATILMMSAAASFQRRY